MAEVNIAIEELQLALDSLELALSQDFNIRNTLHFKLLKCRVLKRQNAMEDAIAVLNQALALPETKELITSMSYLLKR